MSIPRPRLGVDIGGTFTDVVLALGDELFSSKVLTTHSAPDDAVIAGIAEVCAAAGIAPDAVATIIHGTTLATNALIERNGAKTALITTDGFRDVIEMRTESRFEQYDLNLRLPEALVPRRHRHVVEERIGAQGQVLKPLRRAEAEALADRIAGAGYESIAVGLIHSYLNDCHERLVRDVLLERNPALTVSISAEVSPQMREYERFNTVVANAYVKPVMKTYLLRLTGRLKQIGVKAPVFLMHSGGGIMALETAAEFPVRLIESGPAGGAIFAARIAARYDIERALSFDMGGTTAKISLIAKFTPKTSRVFEVARSYRFKKGSGMPISIPVIDMVEIGAGGGSLASVDALRQIRVGPESAGSEPGPACYGQGGAEPAVTDADLMLGRLDADAFAGGAMRLVPEASAAALARSVGKPLGLDDTTAAFGISEVVDENMANAARVHAVENGEDLSGYTMIAFGGAGPVHAGRLCEKLGIDRLLVPAGAGVGSAIGFLQAPFSFEATRSAYMRLDSSFAGAKAVVNELRQEATAFVRSCDQTAEITHEYRAYMRYVGQGWEIPVEIVPDDARADEFGYLRSRFEEAYRSLFGRIVDGLTIEITSWAVKAETVVSPPHPITASTASGDVGGACRRRLFDAARQDWVEAQAVEREAMPAGAALAGPAVIAERETSIIVPTGFRAVMQSDGCVEVTRISTKGDRP